MAQMMQINEETQARRRELGLRIAIVQPWRNALSETFIRAHAERLPGKVFLIHGMPAQYEGQVFQASSLPHRAMRKLTRVARGYEWISDDAASFVRALRHIKPDVVLAEYGPAGVAVEPACRWLDLPLVVHFHGYDASQSDILAQHRESYPKMFKTAAAVVAVSRAMERKLLALGALPDKLHYNPYGVDASYFQPVNPGAAEPHFLAVGRFVEKKAPHMTLLAFAKVCERCPGARLTMIGEGPLLGVCRDLIRHFHLEERVRLLGAQSHERVRDAMGVARGFVQHSVTASNGDSEGTPVAILEAGCSGLPVVATRHAGIPDVVIEEETGLLVDEREIEAMAEQMLRLAVDPELAGNLGRNARRHITTNFSMQQSIDRLSAILEAAVTKTVR